MAYDLSKLFSQRLEELERKVKARSEAYKGKRVELSNLQLENESLKSQLKEAYVEMREEILKQGVRYANEQWDVRTNPNEHDNAHDDFIAGAIWVLKRISSPN